MTKPDLTELSEGEPTALSWPSDPYLAIEQYPGKFRPGDCEAVDGDETSVFEEELAVLRCGLVVMKSQLPLFQQPSADLEEDARLVLAIGEALRPALFMGAASVRYAPVLFTPATPPAPDSDVLTSLGGTLRVLRGVLDSGPLEAETFRTSFSNGLVQLDSQGKVIGQDRRLTEPELATTLRGLQERLGQLRGAKQGMAGSDDPVMPYYFDNPVFFVGWTPAGRIGGLLCNFVD